MLAPVDPNVKLPPAVAAQIARANALIHGEPKPETPAPAPEANQEPAPAPEAAAEPAPAPEPTPSPETHPEAPAPQSQSQIENGSWEQKYRGMEGRVKTLTKENSLLREDIADLRGLVANLEAQLAAPQRELSFDAPKLLTDKEREEYGEEFITVVGKRAEEIAAPLRAELEELRAKVNGVTAVTQQTARQRYFQTLTERVPNWRQFNKDPDFLAWLQYNDRFSGQKRADLLQSADKSNDAARSAAFFESFLAEQAAVAPRAEPQPDAHSGKVPLESLAAPGRAKPSATPQVAEETPFISRSEISRFYADVAAHKFRGRDAEKAQIEAMIWRAQKEGRITDR